MTEATWAQHSKVLAPALLKQYQPMIVPSKLWLKNFVLDAQSQDDEPDIDQDWKNNNDSSSEDESDEEDWLVLVLLYEFMFKTK